MEEIKKLSMISETDNVKNETMFCVIVEYKSGAEYRKWFVRQSEAEAYYDYYLKANVPNHLVVNLIKNHDF